MVQIEPWGYRTLEKFATGNMGFEEFLTHVIQSIVPWEYMPLRIEIFVNL